MASGWRPDLPYNGLPPLPPDFDIESRLVLKQCIGARAALAELKQSVELIPNPAILINTLPLLEAQASSEIENIVTTADDLFRHLEAEGSADPATREALRYRRALFEGLATLERRPLCTRTAEVVCSEIKGTEIRVRTVPGTALVNQASNEVIYSPPDTEARLRDLLANWERFLHADQSQQPDSLDPLIRMAVAHYQFEAIHPFTDGNGRTGRILNSLFLVEQGLLPMPVLYLSRYIIEHKSDYYELLLDVTRRNDQTGWERWIAFMLRGVEETATWTAARIAAMRDLSDEIAQLTRSTLPKIYSRELIDVVVAQPYCRISNLVDAQIAGRQAASRYLKALASIGVLREQAFGREKLFLNTKLLRLLVQEDISSASFRS